MKRIKALILAVLLIGSMVLSLAGCGATTADTALSMGQWVSLLADSFGLQNYTDETPHFSKVTSENYAFSAFQAVAEWGIIKPSDEITSETPVKWNDVLVSLVNAGEFLSDNATNEEKIDFAIKNFDSSIRSYWGNRYIKLKQAIPLLDAAQEMWANKIYTKKIEEATFSNEVVNCIENESIQYALEGSVVTVSSDDLKDLKPGDVYTLPANENNTASINRVKSVEVVDGNVVITNDDAFTEEEAANYIEEVKIQETSSPDFTKIAGIYDENGNPISFEIEDTPTADGMSFANEGYCVTNLASRSGNAGPTASQLGFFDNVKGSLKFKVGEYSVSISTTTSNFSVKLAKEISKSSSRYREQKQEIYVQTTFNDVQLTRDVDYSWGKLHSATVKLDYSTTIEGGIKTERSGEIGNPVTEDGETVKTLSSIFNQYKNALSDLKKSVHDTKCDDDIYICKLALVEGGLASVDFIVKGKVTAEGDIKIVVEVEGSQGIQVKDGKFRYIKTKDVDVDFVAEGSLEVTIAPGVAITILKKIALVEITIDCGLGASVGMTAHLFDIEGHELYSGTAQLTSEDADNLSNESLFTTPEEIEQFAIEQGGTWDAEKKGITGNVTIHKGICLEWKLYPIVRFGIDGKSLVGKIAKKFSVSLSVEILGSKNTILQGHIDFPNNLKNMVNSDSIGGGLSALLGINAECTYDYTPWDEAVEEIETIDPGTESTEIVTSDRITLDTMRVSVAVGKTTQVSVTGIPKGYELSDIVAVSEDPDIAEFDLKSGTITGKKEGTTQLAVQTKDGKHKAYFAVTVTTDEGIDFSGLPGGNAGGGGGGGVII